MKEETIQSNILSKKIRLTIFRAIRELFVNIGKHANAKNLFIDIRIADSLLTVKVKDDGVGFDPTKILNGNEMVDGFGLFSIQQQLMDINGQVSIDSQVGGGTQISITCPLTSSESELTICR